MPHPLRTILVCLSACLAIGAQAADVVMTMNSYGPIQVGMPVAAVHRHLLAMGRKALPNPGKSIRKGCSYYIASSDLKFMLEDGRVVRIETTEKGVVTPSGIRIGSPIERVRHVLGSRIEDVQQKYADSPDARSIVLVSGDRRFAIRVEAGATVDEIYTGAEHAIRYVEGCG